MRRRGLAILERTKKGKRTIILRKKVNDILGKEKSLRKHESTQVVEHRTTHNRKPKTHNTNRL